VTEPPFDPYATLDVTPDADEAVITAAYRALARRHHPDLAGERATAAMAALNVAWELIGTSKARAVYDEERRRRPVATGPGHPAPRTNGAGSRRPNESWFSPAPDGTGAAGPPPGRPSGSVLPFGRHIGWSLGEIVRVDVGYLEWLEERREGRPYREEIDALLRRLGRRGAEPVAAAPRRRFLRRAGS
jgi:curved DNA-binding protein CbpA